MVQSTQRVQEPLPAVSTGTAAQTPAPDATFGNLLENAMNTRPESSKEPTKPEEAVQPDQTRQPKQAAGKAEQPEQSAEPEKGKKPEPQVLEAAATLLIPQPVVIEPPPAELVQPTAAAVVQPVTVLQTQPVLAEVQPVATAVQTPAAAVQPLQAEPVPIVAPTTQASEPAAQAPSAEAASSQAPETQTITTQASSATQPRAEAFQSAPVKAAGSIQERFDTLLVKASKQLSQGSVESRQSQGESQPPPQATEAAPVIKAQAPAPAKEAPKEQRGEQTRQPKAETAEMMRQELPPVQIKGMEEAQAPKQTARPTPAQQVEARLIRQMENGKTEFRMQLVPEELGKVDVRMLLEDGKLTVQIATATAKAAQELQRTGESLMASLRMTNTQLESVQIVHRPEEPSQQMDGAFHRENGQQPGNESRGNQGGQRQNRGTRWQEEAYDLSETPSRLLDQAV